MPGDAERLSAEGLDRAAFDSLVREHGPSCLRLARALAPSGAVAEDIAQQALLAAYRARGGFRGDGSARAWLLTITRHTAYRMLRREARHEEPSTFELGLQAGWGSADPEAAAVAAERRAVLSRALERLNDADREVLVLRDLEQLDGPTTAEVLGIGVRAMKSRLHRARLRLAALLRREGEIDEGA